MTAAFDSLDAFLAMGGHGVYVWSAWAIVLLAIVLLVCLSYRTRQQVRQEIGFQAMRRQQHQTQSSNQNLSHNLSQISSQKK